MPRLKIVSLAVLIFFPGFVPWFSASAQTSGEASLESQLKAHYKLTKTGMDSSGLAIVEAGTVLLLQKGGVLGVPPSSTAIASTIYKDGDLHSPSAAGAGSHFLPQGEKVYVTKLDVNVKLDKVALTILECDSCNGAPKPSNLKATVVFQFPKDYLGKAEADQIQDVIGQILAETATGDSVAAGAGAAQGMSNDDVIKMVQAKLPDAVVVAKIKSSGGNFDTSTDGLIKLKRAGVSDKVLQAIVEAAPASAAAGGQDANAAPAQQAGPAPTCGGYDACMKVAGNLMEAAQWDRALARYQDASQVDPSKGDAWAGMGIAQLQLGQYDDAVAKWDKALEMSGTITVNACHLRGLVCVPGTFSLSVSEVSFVSKKGEKDLTASAPASTCDAAFPYGNGQAYLLNVHNGGKNYRMYYLPKMTGCGIGFVCPDPGPTQQKVFADYVHGALGRIAAGDFGGAGKKH